MPENDDSHSREIRSILNSMIGTKYTWDNQLGYGHTELRFIDCFFIIIPRERWVSDLRSYSIDQNTYLHNIVNYLITSNYIDIELLNSVQSTLQSIFRNNALAATLNFLATNHSERIYGISHEVLDALADLDSRNVVSALSADFLNALDTRIFINVKIDFFNQIQNATWGAVSLSFFEALPKEFLDVHLLRVLNHFSDTKIGQLSTRFLNNLSQSTVDTMINTPRSLRANNFADAIPKNRWLLLNGTKYRTLLQRATVNDISELIKADKRTITAQALNALSGNVIANLPPLFLNELADCTMLATINKLSLSFLNSLSASTVTEILKPTSLRSFTWRINDSLLNSLNENYATLKIARLSPTVGITSDRISFIGNQSSVLTFTLSIISANFSVDDISVSGGTLSDFTGSGRSYMARFTPAQNSTTDATVRVLADKFTNVVGNSNVVSSTLVLSVDTTVLNTPRLWAPNASTDQNTNIMLGLNGTNAVVNDMVEIVRADSTNNVTVLYRYTLTSADITSGRIFITVPYISSATLGVRITSSAGNVGALGTPLTILTDMPADWLNALDQNAISTLAAGFLNALVGVSGLLENISSQFFNSINKNVFVGLSSDLLKHIGQRIYDEQSSTPTNVAKITLSSAQVATIPKDNIKNLLDKWLSESPARKFIPESLLNSMTTDQITAMGANFSNYIDPDYFDGIVSASMIIGLAKNSTLPNLAISNAQLNKLSDDALNAFLGVSLNRTSNTVALPINILNALTPHQVSILDLELFQAAMPVSDIRAGLLNASVIKSMSADQFAQLNSNTLTALSTAIKNNPTKYTFNRDQLSTLRYDFNNNTLAAFLSAYLPVDGVYTGTISHNILNNLNSDQIKRIDRGIINHSIIDLTNTELNMSVLSDLGNAVYAYSSVNLNNPLSAMPATTAFQQLTGDRLVAFFSAWNKQIGGSYPTIPSVILSLLTTNQLSSLPINLIKNNVTASALSAAQLNALPAPFIGQLGEAWLNAISEHAIPNLSPSFLEAIPTDVFKLLRRDFINNIDRNGFIGVSADTIQAIAAQYIGQETAFSDNHVGSFNSVQLEALFRGSASNDSGDYQFANLSNVLSGINLEWADGPIPDELANIPLYILLGTIQNDGDRTRLIINRDNFNSKIALLEGNYSIGGDVDKKSIISEIRSSLLKATDADLALLSFDTINKLSSLTGTTKANWETTGELDVLETIEERNSSIKSILLEKFNKFGKTIVRGVNDAILTAIGQKMKLDIAAGGVSRVISDAQFRALSDHQLSVLLSPWISANASVPYSVLEKFSATQIGELSKNTLSRLMLGVNLSQVPDSFIAGLGYLARNLSSFSDPMRNIGWWTSGESPRREFILSATQLQNFSSRQLELFLTPWMDDPRNLPIPAFILKMLSHAQIADLDDSVYKNLTFDEANAILPKIPVNKITLLKPTAFIYPDVDALIDKSWPSEAQLAAMNEDQVNALFTLWRENKFYSDNLRLIGTNKLMGINDDPLALLFDIHIIEPWYYAVNPTTHLIEKKGLHVTTTISPSDELFRATIFGLSNATRENILIDKDTSSLLFDTYNSDFGSYIATLSFDEVTINTIHSLPLDALPFLNDAVIDFIAEDDESSVALGMGMFLSQAEFTMLTVDQVSRYITSYISQARMTNSRRDLPLAILNAFSPTQVQSLTEVQFNFILGHTIGLLSDAFVSGMTTDQLELLISTGRLSHLRLDQIPFIDKNVIANLGTRLSNFTADQLSNLRPDQIRAIGTVVPTSDVDEFRRPYLNGAAIQAFIDEYLAPNQYVFLNKDAFSYLTQTQMQKISPELIPYINKDIIAQLEINGKLNNFTNNQIWNLTNDQIIAAFPYDNTIPNRLRMSAQVGLSFDQILDSALESSNDAQNILTNLTPEEVVAIRPAVLVEFSDEQLAQLTNAQILNLTLDQINALGQTKYAALAKTPGPALALNVAQIGALNALQINALTAKTIGSFSAAQFKALLHNTAVPFARLDPSLLQFVGAPVLNALNSSELNMWSQEQIAALSPDALSDLSDYNKAIVRAIMGIEDQQISGTRLLQSANSPLDGVYGGFTLPAVPVRRENVIINTNTNLAWTQDKITKISALKGPNKNTARPDYYVSNYDLARTYLTPYRDVTLMRYVMLNNLYTSSNYGESRFDVSPQRKSGTNASNPNFMVDRILQTRKYLQFGRLFGSVLLMLGSVELMKNAWALRDTKPARETASDFLLGIGWIASGLQVPWGAFWASVAKEAAGGERKPSVGYKEFLSTFHSAGNDYFGLSREFPRGNLSQIFPEPSNGAAAGRVGAPVIDTYQLRISINKASEDLALLNAEKTNLQSKLQRIHEAQPVLKERMATSLRTRAELMERYDTLAKQTLTESNLGVIEGQLKTLESQIEGETISINVTRSALSEHTEKNSHLAFSIKEAANKIGAIENNITDLNNQLEQAAPTTPTQPPTTPTQPPTTPTQPPTTPTTPTQQLRTPELVRTAAQTEVIAQRTRTIRFYTFISKPIIGSGRLTFEKKLKHQGMWKGGAVFMIANVMGAINGMVTVINGFIDASIAENGEEEADSGMRIFTGVLSFLGGISLFLGDNIDALADKSPAQKFLGTRYTHIALRLGYISQATSILYKEWATYARHQNGVGPAIWRTVMLVTRLGLMQLNWVARNSVWGSVISTALLTVVPFLLENAVEYKLSENYLDDLEETLEDEGRTTEAALWIPVLKNIEQHASLWGQLNIVTYRQSQLDDLSGKMLANNLKNLKSVLSQYKSAAMLRTNDGLAYLTETINEMINSIYSTNATDALVTDFYVLEMGAASKKNYYIKQKNIPEVTDNKEFGYVLQSHLSVNSLNSTKTSLSRPFAGKATTAELLPYFKVDAFIGNDLDSNGGSVTLTDQVSGISVALIQLIYDAKYYALTGRNFLVDARGATKNMIFIVATHTTILAGSGVNTFNVDQSIVEAGSYQIVAGDILKNEINFTNHKKQEGSLEPIANTIDLDDFSGMRVVQRDINYGQGNSATGSRYGQYYVAGFGGKNIIEMLGGGASVIANGLGNVVELGGDNNAVYVNLLSEALQNYSYQATEIGNYSGSSLATNNTIDFSSAMLAGEETFNLDINNLTSVAAIKNAGVIVDAINFTFFQHVVGSNNGSIVNITGPVKLSSLILNDASSLDRYNIVNLQDVSGLAILSSGKSIITINESNSENNTISGNTNYFYLQGTGGSRIYANANTIVGGRLESNNDSIIFAQDARFNLLEVGQGTHYIEFQGNNSSQIDSDLNGLIKMVDVAVNSHLVVQDQNLRSTPKDTLMIQLASETYADSYRVSYRYNENNNQNEVYFESTTGEKSLNYLTVNTNITSVSHAEIAVFEAENTSDEDTYYSSDINTIIQAITELTIGNVQTQLQFSGYKGYNFNTVLTKVRHLNSDIYVEKYNSYTLATNELNLKLFDSYNDFTELFSNYSGTGNILNNRIIGSFGNNKLDGGIGADVLVGSFGNDTYIVDNVGDMVVEYGEQGIDTVESNVNYALTNNVENIILTGSNSINGIGNDGDNVLTGNSGNNSLVGGAGNDTLLGAMNANIDTLVGGSGDDVYVINTQSSNLVIEVLGEGTDTVQTSLDNFSLSDSEYSNSSIENLTYTGSSTFTGTGNALNNVFSTSTLSNSIRRTFDGGSGSDTIDYSNAITALSITLNGSADGVVTGAVNNILKNIENVICGFGNDSILGDSQDNILVGGEGNNSILGGVGNDTLKGGIGNDILDGGEGIDTVDYSEAIRMVNISLLSITTQLTLGAGIDILRNIENILGSTYGDNLKGSINKNILNGADGNDSLSGQSGDDTLLGGNDDDTLNGGEGNDSLIGGAGFDIAAYQDVTQGVSVSLLISETQNTRAAGSDVLMSIEGILGSAYNDTLTGANTASVLIGGAGNDILMGGAGDDILNGGTDNDSLTGGVGNDVYILDSRDDVIIEVTSQSGGIDTIQTDLTSLTLSLYLGVENLIYTGTSNFVGRGNSNSNVLVGNVGADTLNGAAGSDTLIGGTGNDIYIVDDISEIIIETENSGIDTVRTTLIKYSLADVDNVENITYAGAASTYLIGNVLDNVFSSDTIGNDTYDGGFGKDTVDYSNITRSMEINLTTGTATGAGAYTLINIENIIGGAANDLITGNSADNILYGGAGNNTLVGNDGNDLLESGRGNDTLNGGVGNDTASYRYATAGVTVNLTTGVATGFGADRLIAIENIIGSDFADTLVGSNGDNILDGGRGADILSGGLGNDTYIIDNMADQINENNVTGSGTDTVTLKGNLNQYTLGLNLENLVFMGTTTFIGVGNSLNNILIGGNATDILSGLSGDDSLIGDLGDDSLFGNLGNDTLNGGLGNDTLVGGDSDDVYIVDGINDVIIEEATVNSGKDIVMTMLSNFVITQNVENLTYTGVSSFTGIGNQLANVIIGGVRGDTLDGGEGSDTLIGGIGDDVYVININTDWIIESNNQGNDTIKTSALLFLDLSAAAYFNVENMSYTGMSNFNGIGNVGNNIFSGGIGNDTFNGSLGIDTIDYSQSEKAVTVTLTNISNNATGVDIGTDTLINIENVIGGLGRDTITGNDRDNLLSGVMGSDIISGGNGNDTLDGGYGEDSLVGGNGNDIYIIDDIKDVLLESTSGGIDTIVTTTLYQLDLRGYQNIENIQYTGLGNFVGIGDQYNNVLKGGMGDDSLDGVSGVDTFVGGDGDDVYYLDSADDMVSEEGSINSGKDTVITKFATLTLFYNVENVIYTGTTNFNATGNFHANLLIGGSGNDTLRGESGDDTLLGGIGDDILMGGYGDDTYSFWKTENIDTIEDDIGNADILEMNDITREQLWFTHVGDNLEISVIGTASKVIINNWYAGSKIETIKANQSTLTSTAVESLVQAMASMTPPASGVTTLSNTEYNSIISAINTMWGIEN